MKLFKNIPSALAISALMVALSACDMNKGPAEEAGENIDEATEQAGKKIEEAGEKIQDAAEGNTD